jgi:hypothetical protein
MRIETITVMERKNLNNYEHIEITASAKVEENDDAYSSLLTLKTLVHFALEGKAATMTSVPTAKVEEVKHEAVEEVTVPAVKEKKTRAKKEIVQEITAIPVSDEKSNILEAPVGKNVVIYNRDLDTHRQLLSSYLNKNHPSWKTTEGVKEFSMGLVGKPFLNDDGAVVESFAKLLSDFFNA